MAGKNKLWFVGNEVVRITIETDDQARGKVPEAVLARAERMTWIYNTAAKKRFAYLVDKDGETCGVIEV